jgi:hypothetical protein
VINYLLGIMILSVKFILRREDVFTRYLKLFIQVIFVFYGFGSTLSVASTHPSIYAVGASYDGFSQYPILLKSDDLGLHWNRVNVGVDGTGGWINRATCTQQFCLAVGDYHDLKNSLYPLVLQSHNNGDTWSIRELHQDTDETIIDYVYCNAQLCMVSGSSSYSRFIATTHDAAGSWLHTRLDEDVFLDQFDCSHSFCMGAGSKSVANRVQDIAPHLIVSQDKGLHWRSIDFLTIDGWPKQFSKGRVRGTTCISDRCILAGEMYDDLTVHAFIAVGNDQGNTWSMKKVSESYSWFQSISCSSQVCVAIGEQERKASLYVSYDQGDSWSPVSSIPSLSENTTFKSVHCSENNCMVAGLDENLGLLLASTDAGHSWKFVDTKRQSDGDYFYQVKCKTNICIANGETKDKDQEHIPLLAVYDLENKSLHLQVFSNKRETININDIFFATP